MLPVASGTVWLVGYLCVAYELIHTHTKCVRVVVDMLIYALHVVVYACIAYAHYKECTQGIYEWSVYYSITFNSAMTQPLSLTTLLPSLPLH